MGSNPAWSLGYVPTPTEWNNLWAGKADDLTEATLTYSSSLSWNVSTNPIAKVTLTGNVTITTSSGTAGQSYRLAVIQDATGGRAVTLAGCTLLGFAAWATAANGVNLLTIDDVGGTLYAVVT